MLDLLFQIELKAFQRGCQILALFPVGLNFSKALTFDKWCQMHASHFAREELLIEKDSCSYDKIT